VREGANSKAQGMAATGGGRGGPPQGSMWASEPVLGGIPLRLWDIFVAYVDQLVAASADATEVSRLPQFLDLRRLFRSESARLLANVKGMASRPIAFPDQSTYTFVLWQWRRRRRHGHSHTTVHARCSSARTR